MRTTIILLLFVIWMPLTLQSQDDIYEYAKAVLGYTTEEELKEVSDSDRKGLYSLSFVGDGNLQNSLNNGEKLQANTGIGIILSRFWVNSDPFIRSLDLSFNINVATTADSLTTIYEEDRFINASEFGTYLLLPRSAKQSGMINLDLYFNDYETNKIFRAISGWNAQLIASTNFWTDTKQNVSTKLAGLSFRTGPFYEFINDKIRKDDGYSIQMGLSYSFRQILGDLSFRSNEDLKHSFLNSRENYYSGIEITGRFKINNIVAEIALPLLARRDEVSGLTRSQFISSISFVGGFPIATSKKTKDAPRFDTLGI